MRAFFDRLPLGHCGPAGAKFAEIVACGRSRWKIENESFNVLKNHGYELEHNFGHGQKSVSHSRVAVQPAVTVTHREAEAISLSMTGR